MRAINAQIIWCILLGSQYVLCTLTPDSKNKNKRDSKFLRGPQDNDVFTLNLVSPEPLAKDILIHHEGYYKDTALRRFNGTVLGYVTPWNSHGYDIAKIFAKKFDIISPVWLQIVKRGDEYAIAGDHDIDAGWINDVRRKGKVQQQQQLRTVKFFPRIIFDHFTDRDIKLLLSDAKERTELNEMLIRVCKQHGFDGLVLEVWSQLAGRIDDKILYTLVLQMAKELQKQKIRLILVIPPQRKDMPNLFGEKHMDKLYKYIYAFSLMTYDYSTVQRPGANAPLYWVRSAVEHIVPDGCQDMEVKRAKILLGLNMYGNDYTPDGGGPITYGPYLDLLRHVKKHLTHDERDMENFFEIRTETGRHIVFYPTLYSINERIQLAQQLGVGISIWELGQGLNYFYDLF
ncbi:chitinase domain-containing protein 1 [Drosophila mojavensis]|uniref:Chitinase domain-containing protein 1 n=2 Tax=Drosophila mojavensis TaxID=7230 RepID=B4KGW4_DROMO|nr:chitinase domain-containing protein 1 [Drosophila mojavensis]XP_032585112.1 chitinase domain-containing protein 1 [Drosophila mojavensis]EDW11164.1 moj30 [Drosophila mojavensis]